MIYKFFLFTTQLQLLLFLRKISQHKKLTGSYKRVAVFQNEFASLCKICEVILGPSYSKSVQGPYTNHKASFFQNFPKTQVVFLSTHFSNKTRQFQYSSSNNVHFIGVFALFLHFEMPIAMLTANKVEDLKFESQMNS